MKSYAEALEIIIESITLLKSTKVPIENAVGYVLKSDIKSEINVAPYRNSAMDGFAVAYDDIAEIPFSLPVKAVSYAGDSDRYDYQKKTALKIMTGAPVPDGYDTVVRVEDTTFNSSEVTFHKPINKSQNVRQPGEDIQAGEVIFNAGRKINQLDIGILASLGLKEIEVYRKPKVLVVSSGNELVQPGNELTFGQLYNSNSYTIQSMVKPFCQTVDIDSILLDEPEQVETVLLKEYDIMITSGGVSAGDKDLIPAIAEKVGWIKKLHKAAIKPGKPIFFAEKNNQYLFGLPGNPLSTAVTLAIFVIPAIKKMIGLHDYMLKREKIVLSKNSIMKSGRTLIWPGKIEIVNGVIEGSFADKKSSAALSALLNSDGLIFQFQKENQPTEIEFVEWQQILQI